MLKELIPQSTNQMVHHAQVVWTQVPNGGEFRC